MVLCRTAQWEVIESRRRDLNAKNPCHFGRRCSAGWRAIPWPACYGIPEFHSTSHGRGAGGSPQAGPGRCRMGTRCLLTS